MLMPIVGGMEGHARPKSKMGRDRLPYKSQMAQRPTKIFYFS